MKNEQLILSLVKKHAYQRREGRWAYTPARVVRDYNKLNPQNQISTKDINGKFSAKKIERIVKDMSIVAYGDISSDKLPRKELVINKDGSRSIFDYAKMTNEQSKDPDYVMEVAGYNPDTWTLLELRISEWNPRNKDGELLQSYAFSMKLRPKVAKDMGMRELKRLIGEMSYSEPQINLIPHDDNPKGVQIDFADLHIFSGHLDVDELFSKVERIKEHLIRNQFESLYLCWLGDILHVDSIDEKTTRGTQLKITGSVYEMLREGVDIVTHIIRELAIVPNTEVIWVQGNHSRTLEYMVMMVVEKEFRDNTHIKFDVDERFRKAFLYGSTLVGLHHGDMPKKNQFEWLQFEFSGLWGQAKYWEIHGAHFHSEQVETRGGVVARTVTTPKSTDTYEARQGYNNNRQKIMLFEYDKTDGLDTIKYY